VVPQVFKDEAQQDRGEMARMNSFIGAIAVADLVKTTLGPKGMDKILKPLDAKDQKITVTNDGATILKSVYVDNAAAKILIDISKTQDEEVGDGTTTVAVLAGELLREAEQLVNSKIHPQIILQGYRLAVEEARRTLLSLSQDNSSDSAAFVQDLRNIAGTTLSSKLLTQEKELFVNLAVDAVQRLRGSDDLKFIQIIKKPGGNLRDSFIAEGFILEKKITTGSPKTKLNPRILVANTPMDYDKIKIYGSKVKVDSMDKVAEIEAAEKEKMKRKVNKILAHKPDVFINRQLIYNYPESLLAEHGVMVIEHADFDGVERLSAVLGADILSTFDNPELAQLGTCEMVDEIIIGEDKVIRFSGCHEGRACTIVLRGASTHLLDEAERSLHDALCVLVQTVKNTKVVFGGGHSEIAMSEATDALAKKVPGKRSLAIEAFGRALRKLPTIISENGGYDSAELISKLRAAIVSGSKTAGLDMYRGEVGDMQELGVKECLRVKEAALLAAAEAAEMIIRVDDILTCAPRRREGH
jgi:T-complex protein 1 subunit beta